MPLGANKAAIMGVAGVSTADVVLLSTTTIGSDSDTVTISANITSTYGEYIFGFYRITCDTGDNVMHFQVNGAGESGFNEVMTTTHFRAQHSEADDYVTLGYPTAADQAQGTGYQTIFAGLNGDGTAADECANGVLHLFNPSSTTYVKHFYSRFIDVNAGNSNEPGAWDGFTAGYINTTTAIDEISFKMLSGQLEGGVIKLWGVK